MNRHLQRVEKGAAAEHIATSNLFMAEQSSDVLAMRQGRDADLHKDIAACLAPREGSIDDFVDEHEAIRRQRHENSCRWVLDHKHFASWLAVPSEQHATLWITAGPGARKSTLMSFVIDYLRTNFDPDSSPRIAFFYSKASTTSQNNATDAIPSLTWQLYLQNGAANNALDTNFFKNRRMTACSEPHDV